MNTELSQEFAWHHLICRIPSDWEVTAYSIESRVGRVEFSTRMGVMAVFSWEPVKREPDRESTLKAFLRKLSTEDGKTKFTRRDEPAIEIREQGAWMLAAGKSGPVQAMRYQPDTEGKRGGFLLSWTLERGAGVSELPRWMLALISGCEANEADVRLYSIHGIRAHLGKKYAVEAMHVHPANVMIHFEASDQSRIVYRRWGLPFEVLGARDMKQFLPWLLQGAGMRVDHIDMKNIRSFPGAEAAFSMRGVYRMDKLLGRRWTNGRAYIWHNTDEKRLYTFEAIGPRNVKLPSFSEACQEVVE